VWVADRVKAGETAVIESAPDAAVLVAGFQGAAAIARGGPAATIGRLAELFAIFDGLVDAVGIQTVKGTGHGYVVAAGIPAALADQAPRIADLALAMQHAATTFAREAQEPLRLRIGIHTGPVVAGLIASRRLSFDIWGDGVDTAQQLQASAAGGTIQVSPAAHAQMRDAYSFVSRGVVDVPGKGQMRTYLLQGRVEVAGPAPG
jgi:class 3 adenylate cyclase